MVSRLGLAYRFALDEIPSTGLRSKGVKSINLAKDDSVGFGCVLDPKDSAVLFMTEQGQMKRVKIDEITIGTRPIKGNLICKRLKTNPSRIAYAMGISSGRELAFYDPEEQLLKASDIPLKSRDTGFSAPLVLKKGWTILKGIEECRIVDTPAGADTTVHNDVEPLNLFGEEE